MSDIIRPEMQHSINGVSGRLFTLRVPPSPWVSGVFANQSWVSERRPVKGYGEPATLQVNIRFDDNCRNGHQSFAITGDIRGNRGRDIAGGCLHEDIAKVFPELAPLIRWHLCATDGPMHYVANTLYLAGDRDCHGLRKGERRQIRNGKTGEPCWELVAIVNGEPVPLRDIPAHPQGECAPVAPELRYVPWDRIGEGKARELDAARSVAVWPDATDEELCAPPEVLKAALVARLPGLIAEFRRDMEAAGFLWEAPKREGN